VKSSSLTSSVSCAVVYKIFLGQEGYPEAPGIWGTACFASEKRD
jgi:hypothetical protein